MTIIQRKGPAGNTQHVHLVLGMSQDQLHGVLEATHSESPKTIGSSSVQASIKAAAAVCCLNVAACSSMHAILTADGLKLSLLAAASVSRNTLTDVRWSDAITTTNQCHCHSHTFPAKTHSLGLMTPNRTRHSSHTTAAILQMQHAGAGARDSGVQPRPLANLHLTVQQPCRTQTSRRNPYKPAVRNPCRNCVLDSCTTRLDAAK
jgi:hypothetical protein